MRDAHAELWLANQRIEQEVRSAPLRAELPPSPSISEILRRRTGEALIAAGQRLLPTTTKRTVARAA